MPGPDLRGLPSRLLRAPHGERQGRGEGWVGVGAWGRQPPVLMGVAAGGCAAGR